MFKAELCSRSLLHHQWNSIRHRPNWLYFGFGARWWQGKLFPGLYNPLIPFQCAVTFFTEVSLGFGPQFTLGDTFIRGFCNTYDVGNSRVGFSRVSSRGPPKSSHGYLVIFHIAISSFLYYVFHWINEVDYKVRWAQRNESCTKSDKCASTQIFANCSMYGIIDTCSFSPYRKSDQNRESHWLLPSQRGVVTLIAALALPKGGRMYANRRSREGPD